jgi:hypothetical protein
MADKTLLLPRRLRDDSIAEAICEFRFSAGELPEIVVGRLAPPSSQSWRPARAFRVLAQIPGFP